MNRAITIFIIVAVATQLWAQEPTAPKPTDAHQLFADDAGTWDAVVKAYHQGPSGPATQSSGIETNELVSGGLYSRTTFRFKMRGREFEGHGLFGYDPRSQEYTGTWVDNFTTIPTQMTGKYDPKQKTLTMFGTVVDDSGNEIKQKQITKYIDAKTKAHDFFIIIGAGGKKRDVKIMGVTLKKRS